MRVGKHSILSKKNEDGFTLIELLISIFIFAIVMSMIYGAFRIVINSAETVKHGDVPYEQGRSALERITLDLGGLYVSHEAEYNLLKKEGEQDPYQVKLGRDFFSGRSFSSLRFVSSGHASFSGEGQGIISEVILYVAQVNGDRYELRRSDRRFFDKDNERSSRDPVLCRNVLRFDIQAIDTGGMEQDNWDSESGTGNGSVPASFSIFLETGTSEGKAFFRTSVPCLMRRMKNIAVPDDVGGTSVKTETEKQEVKK